MCAGAIDFGIIKVVYARNLPEINCLLNAGREAEQLPPGMIMYSTLIPCNMCAGAIVHSGIIKVVYGESRNLPEDNGRELLVRYGVELADLAPREGWADAQGLH